MSRLIDADELENMNFTNVASLGGVSYVPLSEVIGNIRQIPTAYSIEKVVAELERVEEHCLNMCDWQGQSAIADAIEIVKAGGMK